MTHTRISAVKEVSSKPAKKKIKVMIQALLCIATVVRKSIKSLLLLLLNRLRVTVLSKAIWTVFWKTSKLIERSINLQIWILIWRQTWRTERHSNKGRTKERGWAKPRRVTITDDSKRRESEVCLAQVLRKRRVSEWSWLGETRTNWRRRRMRTNLK